MVKKSLITKVVWPVLVGLTMLVILIGVSSAQDPCTPSITGLTPDLGPPWMNVAISGEKFGEKIKDDAVFVGSQKAPIYFWSDTLIKVKVPFWLSSGIYNIIVKKAANLLTGCEEKTSNEVPFEVTDRPIINDLDPMESTCWEQLDIYGEGFGLEQEQINADGFGYSTYVELYASANRYRITKYPDGWLGPDHIKIWFESLLDVNTGLQVPEEHLYHGFWNLMVRTNYFVDNGNGIHNLGLNGLDPGDKILYRAMSNPMSLEVTPCEKSQPVIYYLYPSTAPASRPGAPSKVVIKGFNFGETQGSSQFHIGGRTWYEGHPKIKFWSDHKIKFKIPLYKAPFLKYKEVWVTVGGIDSNKVMLAILEP